MGHVGRDAGILRDTLVDEDRLARVGLDLAISVERNVQAAQIPAPIIGGDDQHRVARWRRDHGGIGPLSSLHIAQRRVAVPAHDDVNAIHRGGQLLVHAVTQVGQGHDLVDPLVLQGLHHRPGGIGGIPKVNIGAGTGDKGRVRRRQAKNAHLFTGDVQDRVGLDEAAQIGIPRSVQVGAQDRKSGLLDKAGQSGRAEVEFVVANGHGLIAQGIHKVRFLLTLPLVEGPLRVDIVDDRIAHVELRVIRDLVRGQMV